MILVPGELNEEQLSPVCLSLPDPSPRCQKSKSFFVLLSWALECNVRIYAEQLIPVLLSSLSVHSSAWQVNLTGLLSLFVARNAVWFKRRSREHHMLYVTFGSFMATTSYKNPGMSCSDR